MMDRTLGYLRESLSNHLEHDVCRGIYKKLQVKHYANEGEFVKDLNDLKVHVLNQVLETEIKYAENEQDQKPTMEWNEV